MLQGAKRRSHIAWKLLPMNRVAVLPAALYCALMASFTLPFIDVSQRFYEAGLSDVEAPSMTGIALVTGQEAKLPSTFEATVDNIRAAGQMAFGAAFAGTLVALTMIFVSSSRIRKFMPTILVVSAIGAILCFTVLVLASASEEPEWPTTLEVWLGVAKPPRPTIHVHHLHGFWLAALVAASASTASIAVARAMWPGEWNYDAGRLQSSLGFAALGASILGAAISATGIDPWSPTWDNVFWALLWSLATIIGFLCGILALLIGRPLWSGWIGLGLTVAPWSLSVLLQ
jgi:hypothetical protein